MKSGDSSLGLVGPCGRVRGFARYAGLVAAAGVLALGGTGCATAHKTQAQGATATGATTGAATNADAAAQERYAQWRSAVDAGMKRLEPLLGTWSAKGTMGPVKADGTRDEQTGTWTNTWVFPGKVMQLRFDVALAGRPMSYVCLINYNGVRGRYETVWAGSGGFRFAETGNFDGAGTALTLTAEQEDIGTGGTKMNVSVFRFLADGTITVTDTQPDEKTGKMEQSFYVRLERAGK